MDPGKELQQILRIKPGARKSRNFRVTPLPTFVLVLGSSLPARTDQFRNCD